MENNYEEVFIPILIIAFNRPEITKQTFSYIQAARPKKLYIAVDGPRDEVKGEACLVKKVKKILQNIDWECQTYYKYNETNEGAELTVSSAISWVFEKEEYAIILEDDIIAPLSFLKFAQELLIRYKDDHRVGIISGNNFTPIHLSDESDYFFAKYAHSWGWATWKRTWECFDLNVKIHNDHLHNSFLKKISNSKKEARFYKKRFETIKRNGPGNNTWDVVANYILRKQNKINIIPRVNLTSNIGVYGLHARGESCFHNLPVDENFTVKHHPKEVKVNTEYDIYHFKEHILKHQNNLIKRIINKISKLLVGKKIF